MLVRFGAVLFASLAVLFGLALSPGAITGKSYGDTTPLSVCMLRAIESLRPPSERLFNDKFATSMFPGPARPDAALTGWMIQYIHPVAKVLINWVYPGVMEIVACRTRFIDDAIRTACATGVRQVVILGAGYDTRALRLPCTGVRYFEVDREAIQAYKKERYAAATAQAAAQVSFVQVDFATQSLAAELRKAGFSAQLPTTFVMEGVTVYITREAFVATLGFVASVPGARLIFTYFEQAALDRPEEWGGPHAELNLARMQKIVTARGEPFISGYAPGEMQTFLGMHGLRLEQDACEDACLAYLRQHGRTGRGPDGDAIPSPGPRRSKAPRLGIYNCDLESLIILGLIRGCLD